MDNESDYGSDFSPEEEAIVESLLFAHSLEDDNPIVDEIGHHDQQSTLKLPRVLGREKHSSLFEATSAAEAVADQIRKSTTSVQQFPDFSNHERSLRVPEPEADLVVHDQPRSDTRSPLERFRTPPRKTLSVTDLVSPAWCEIQYLYTLSHHGRKKPTPAMKQGSKVHQALEAQVHTIVEVDIETKEDAWGLRIWNVIQGLRTLRSTGLTRELEVWGIVDGLVVNGVIDELTYTCPDVDLEQLLKMNQDKQGPGPDQMSISDFFASTSGVPIAQSTRSKRKANGQKIYIGDVKTRSRNSLPNATSFRPTRMQLMLYHRLLSDLAGNSVDFKKVMERYDLDGQKTFSDSFIVRVGNLNTEFICGAESQPSTQENLPSTQDSMMTFLSHNNLTALWSLMIDEFRETIPDKDHIGKILKAEYRSRETGEIMGVKTIVMDVHELDKYVTHGMKWWRGSRAAQGVVVQEAFKCRSCDFADICEWRLKKVEEAKENVRLTRKRNAVV